ncbi:ectonucleotide pyrophosphatase/phosphodiesterase family member 5-like [Centruroides vittatus]|uniref:ectonucleotide pyrophosphatase/phosphodiesterase family member 5-like n=1 Tax=Centruroides vittatus TaxID=120091 RepID=UPI00351085C6
MAKICMLLLLFLLISIIGTSVSRTVSRPVGRKVLLISFDGFRWDYYKNYKTPNLDYLAKTGVHAPTGILAAFATKTFPNHYSIITGLHQESHGIVDNTMYDPVFNKSFRMHNTKDSAWWGGEPIWVTARKQGMRVGVYFWPSSDIKIQNIRPNYFFKYNIKTPFEKRIDTAVNWLANDQVEIALVYFNQPDNIGHKTGAMSEGVRKTVESLDKLVGYLLEKLLEKFLLDRVNLIITSDHGMANITKKEHLIALEKYVHLKREVKWIPAGGPVVGILPQEGKLDIVYNKLKHAHPNMSVYKKEEIPERWHYKNHRRIMPILAVADEGYLIARKYRENSTLGQHGYDNNLTSMRPIFFARGPDFKENYKTRSFDITNIYPLICYLLGINSAPNNGSLTEVSHMLRTV